MSSGLYSLWIMYREGFGDSRSAIARAKDACSQSHPDEVVQGALLRGAEADVFYVAVIAVPKSRKMWKGRPPHRIFTVSRESNQVAELAGEDAKPYWIRGIK